MAPNKSKGDETDTGRQGKVDHLILLGGHEGRWPEPHVDDDLRRFVHDLLRCGTARFRPASMTSTVLATSAS